MPSTQFRTRRLYCNWFQPQFATLAGTATMGRTRAWKILGTKSQICAPERRGISPSFECVRCNLDCAADISLTCQRQHPGLFASRGIEHGLRARTFAGKVSTPDMMTNKSHHFVSLIELRTLTRCAATNWTAGPI